MDLRTSRRRFLPCALVGATRPYDADIGVLFNPVPFTVAGEVAEDIDRASGGITDPRLDVRPALGLHAVSCW